MVVGQCLLDIRLFGMHSLKDKRRVTKSLIARLQQRFGVSCAEVGANDCWGRVLLGIALVTNQEKYALDTLNKVVLWVEDNIDGEVVDFQIDIIT
ncbi:MAG: DUF503 domain-containing protein [Firmicutes bacterium]|nr:DUF503 domain-containing protein [Candidatus Fermentithermobacillaceae bacterium]HON86624.1 DUF503 domain-containing protein [Bacillota bacterium]HOV66348.1 DUF503 domain-containing protein [Bacillota bacterium]